jgi:S-adenosylmethionine/arginine decarboxylase-like enzyme
MNAMGIIYPHCWETLYAKTTFPSHLTVLKTKSYHPKPKGASGTLIVSLLDPTLLDQQMSFFYLTMKNNSHGALHLLPNYNPRIKLWG